MTSPVKSRHYHSPRRRAQADETRRAILDAARKLFENCGYGATSMPSIADEAGVALKTLYVGFENKPGLLRAVWDARFGGDEETTPVRQRQWYREIAAENDPRRKLTLLAAHSRRVKSSSGALLESIRNASSLDADVAALWRDIETKLLEVHRSIVEQLRRAGDLAPSLTITRATDIVWTLNHPTVWQLFVRDRRWTPHAYEQWLFEAFCSQLLTGEQAAPSKVH
jgi:AcrR family transcriptional regulator